ncbi:hypothetical protein [Cellulomonas sp. URHE0023]|uniref:hypothetical protein n=1 Tax=Cellulomonas sp. URHE0023 TaxID=1380354 RepID=UPI0004870240|nr:hypothetical protein [Cellulomonas sp. URHE0023]
MTVHGRRSVVGALMALVTATVLSACAGQPGAAAVVDGTGIPASDVQVVLDELGPYVQGASPAAILGVLVIEPTVTEMAAEAGVAASDEDAEAFLDQVVQQTTPDAHPTFSPASLAIARYFAAVTNLASLSSQEQVTADITERVADLDVEVNPRFATLGKGNTITDPVPPAWVIDPATQGGASSGEPGDGPAPSPSATP